MEIYHRNNWLLQKDQKNIMEENLQHE